MWGFVLNSILMHKESNVFDKDKPYTFEEIGNLAVLYGEDLKKRLGNQKKCAILCENGFLSAIAILACWYAKKVPIPLSLKYGERNFRKILELVTPAVVITDDTEVCDYSLIYNMKTRKFCGDFVDEQEEEDLEEIALIMCTSGTTGNPKGAMITVEGLKQNVIAISKYFEIDSKDTILIARPLYHCAVLSGEFLVSVFKGVNVVFEAQAYNPRNILGLIEKSKITVLCGTPTMFYHIASFRMRRKENIQIKTIALSGECLTKEVAKKIREAFEESDIYSIYGLTEASPRVSFLPTMLFDDFSESVGIPIQNTQVKITNPETGLDCCCMEKGLVMVKSPSLMRGYYKNKELTERTIVEGWLNTRDIGYIDKNGYLYIISRFDDMIIKGGMNIYPKEIENEIIKFEEVKEAVAYGVKQSNGEDIAIDIVLNQTDESFDVKKFMRKMTSVLPAYQIPTIINIRTSLEKNASGKIVRPRK